MTREEIEGISRLADELDKYGGEKLANIYRNILAHIDQLEAELADTAIKLTGATSALESTIKDNALLRGFLYEAKAELARVKAENERLAREVRLRDRVME